MLRASAFRCIADIQISMSAFSGFSSVQGWSTDGVVMRLDVSIRRFRFLGRPLQQGQRILYPVISIAVNFIRLNDRQPPRPSGDGFNLFNGQQGPARKEEVIPVIRLWAAIEKTYQRAVGIRIPTIFFQACGQNSGQIVTKGLWRKPEHGIRTLLNLSKGQVLPTRAFANQID